MLSNSESSSATRSHNDVLKQVLQIVGESSGVPEEQLQESSLLRELPWDSLDVVECAMELEEQFDISIPENVMDEATTIKDLADFVFTAGS